MYNFNEESNTLTYVKLISTKFACSVNVYYYYHDRIQKSVLLLGSDFKGTNVESMSHHQWVIAANFLNVFIRAMSSLHI